jgi:hypothetical protein
MSLEVVNNAGDQTRFEDTRNRLAALRGAITGPTEVSTWGKGVQGGFIVDNGKLPETLSELIQKPITFESFRQVIPKFDPSPASSWINDGGEIDLTVAKAALLKGYRGNYILGRATDDSFRDGWGNKKIGSIGKDCPSNPGDPGDNLGSDLYTANYGWCITRNINDFYIDSYGHDGAIDPSPLPVDFDPYDMDRSMEGGILEDDWQVEISGATVRLINLTGNDIDLAAAKLKASILVYINNANNDINPAPDTDLWWKATTNVSLPPANWIDGNGDGICGASLPCSQEVDVIFPSGIPRKIPIGEHMLVLSCEHTTTLDDNPILSDPTTCSGLPIGIQTNIVNRVKFFPRSGVPDLRLEIH